MWVIRTVLILIDVLWRKKFRRWRKLFKLKNMLRKKYRNDNKLNLFVRILGPQGNARNLGKAVSYKEKLKKTNEKKELNFIKRNDDK